MEITFKLLYTITMSTLVTQLPIEQAHKEFNYLVDKIAAKYEQLDSGEFRVVGTPGFNAKSGKLAYLFAGMSQLSHRLNLPIAAQLHILQTLKNSFRSKFVCRQAVLLCGGCSFVSHRPLRITGLLNTLSFLRIGSWLCILPTTTIVV